MLTNADFARLCTFIAKNAAAWAGDSLMLPEGIGAPVDPHAAERFCREMNGWVSHIRTALRERTDNDA